MPVALITGCSSGIGRALADVFKAAGFKVWATARKAEDVAALAAAGFNAVQLDVNDGPALARAHIGLAMGAAGTATALEAADVAIMDDDPRKIGTFVRLSHLTAAVLKQNIALALGIKLVFFALALTGHATLWMAVLADMGASLIVVFNGLRLLRFKD